MGLSHRWWRMDRWSLRILLLNASYLTTRRSMSRQTKTENGSLNMGLEQTRTMMETGRCIHMLHCTQAL